MATCHNDVQEVKNQWLSRTNSYTGNRTKCECKTPRKPKTPPKNTKFQNPPKNLPPKNVRRQVRPPLRRFASDLGDQSRHHTQDHATTGLLSLPNLQAKPALFSHFQVMDINPLPPLTL